MFERFTDRARRVVVVAQDEARLLNHNYIGTEHILLGLIREGEGVAAQVLMNLGPDLSRVRQTVIDTLSGMAGSPGVRVRPSGLERARETPAAAKAGVQARRLAGAGAVGSQHYLLGLLAEENGLAAKALAELGVTRQAVEEKLAELEPTGTSDETPEEAGARRIGLRVEGQLLMLEVDDPELAAALEKAMVGRKLRIIKGTDPEAVGFPGLWSSVSRTVEDLTRRLGRMGGTSIARGMAAGPIDPEEWRPPGWHPSGHAAVYWIVNSADGRQAHLHTPDAAGGAGVKEWLRTWLMANRGLLLRREERGESLSCSLWAYVDRHGDSFTMTSFGSSPHGPPGCRPVPLDDLIEWALADLA